MASLHKKTDFYILLFFYDVNKLANNHDNNNQQSYTSIVYSTLRINKILSL